MTYWRRLRRWTDAGVFDQLHQIMLAKLNAANRIDWSRAAVDGSHIDAEKGVPEQVRRRSTGASPVPSIICDGHGTPLLVLTSGANISDISRAVDLLDLFPPVAGRPGRPRRRFAALLADKGYDSEAFRQACRERGTEPIIPKRKTDGVKGLGKLRYVVEQTLVLQRHSPEWVASAFVVAEAGLVLASAAPA